MAHPQRFVLHSKVKLLDRIALIPNGFNFRKNTCTRTPQTVLFKERISVVTLFVARKPPFRECAGRLAGENLSKLSKWIIGGQHPGKPRHTEVYRNEAYDH